MGPMPSRRPLLLSWWSEPDPSIRCNWQVPSSSSIRRLPRLAFIILLSPPFHAPVQRKMICVLIYRLFSGSKMTNSSSKSNSCYVGHSVADFLFVHTHDWILLLGGCRSDFVNTLQITMGFGKDWLVDRLNLYRL